MGNSEFSDNITAENKDTDKELRDMVNSKYEECNVLRTKIVENKVARIEKYLERIKDNPRFSVPLYFDALTLKNPQDLEQHMAKEAKTLYKKAGEMLRTFLKERLNDNTTTWDGENLYKLLRHHMDKAWFNGRLGGVVFDKIMKTIRVQHLIHQQSDGDLGEKIVNISFVYPKWNHKKFKFTNLEGNELKKKVQELSTSPYDTDFEYTRERLTMPESFLTAVEEDMKHNMPSVDMLTLSKYGPSPHYYDIEQNRTFILTGPCVSCLTTVLPILTLFLQLFFLAFVCYDVFFDIGTFHRLKPWVKTSSNMTTIFSRGMVLTNGTTNPDAFCELSFSNEKHVVRKMVAFVIGWFHSSRLLQSVLVLHQNHQDRKHGDWIYQKSDQETIFECLPTPSSFPGLRVDYHLFNAVSILTIVLNLVIVMRSTSVMNMILSSLALEFIGNLNDVYKRMFLDSPSSVKHMSILYIIVANWGPYYKGLPDHEGCHADEQNSIIMIFPCGWPGRRAALLVPPVITAVGSVFMFVCA